MAKKVLITGITGQDGSYLAPLLLDKGYEVHALIRRTSNERADRLEDIFHGQKITFHEGSLQDLGRIKAVMEEVRPHEIYNLAGQSNVALSFNYPVETWDINYYGVGRVVNEALRVNPDVRIYQASSSEMFGNSPAPQSETTPFNPQSPYAESKLRAHLDFIVHFREIRNAFTVSGFLFNHESPRRGTQFVTRKITHSFAKIAAGLQPYLELGNLNAVRDWGHAADYVRAMYRMLQQDTPQDYVIASGKSHSVRDFVNIVAKHFDIEIAWEGEDVEEIGRNKKTGEILVKVNPEFYRPREVNYMEGNSEKAKTNLMWEPEYSFEELVREMAEEDRKLIERMSVKK